MAIKNIVPRVDMQGTIGRSDKHWEKVYADDVIDKDGNSLRERLANYVKSVNGATPNENGAVTIDVGANKDLSNLTEVGRKAFLPTGMCYINIPVSGSSVEYTAPANGWIRISAQSNTSSGDSWVNVSSALLYNMNRSDYIYGADVTSFIPIEKGNKATLSYRNVMNVSAIFLYNNGEVPV